MLMKLERNKLLLHLSGVNLKVYFPSTRKAYCELCPINGTHHWKNPHCRGAGRRSRLQFEWL